MDQNGATDLIIRIFHDLQESVSEDKNQITGKTCPLSDLVNFDSLASIMFTGILLEEIGEDEDSEIQNLFVGEDGYGTLYALTIDEIAKKIVELYKENMEK